MNNAFVLDIFVVTCFCTVRYSSPLNIVEVVAFLMKLFY